MVATSNINTRTQQDTRTAWAIDGAHTLAEFSAKHMMITTVKGRFNDVSGVIQYDENDITNSSVTANINAATLATGVEFRDNHLRSAEFIDAENYPQINFTSKKIEKKGDDELEITGDLTIRGVTREVVLKTEIDGFGTSYDGSERAGFTARTQINRKDFGLNWNVALEKGGVLVGDTVKIELHVQAIKQA